MLPGFLPTTRESTFMMDVVVLAMLGVLPVLTWSIYLVKVRKNYHLHKRIQWILGIVLLATITLFEIDIRRDSSWWDRAMRSPFYTSGVLQPMLGIHLCFSITTTLLWAWVLLEALWKFPSPPSPGPYSPRHRLLARFAAIDMYCTAVTGWTFYWMAFVA